MNVAAHSHDPASAPIVLLYHRVATTSRDPQALRVSPENFDRQMALLRREGTPIGLAQLIRAVSSGNAPDRAVAVTFDDGYADNLEIALPILAKHGIPATFFISPAGDGGPGEFWWDALERIVLSPPHLPKKLQISIGGAPFQWRNDTDAPGAPSDPAWNVLGADDPTPRQQLYLALCRLLRPLRDVERDAVLKNLFDWSAVPTGIGPTHRRLTNAQIATLAAGHLAEVGAHTLTHPVLATLPIELQRREITGSKERLEAMIGRPVTAFSYPYGGRRDYSAESVDIVRRAGFNMACANSGRPPDTSTTFKGIVNRFAIPRAIVRDVDVEQFAAGLRRSWEAPTLKTCADHAAALA